MLSLFDVLILPKIDFTKVGQLQGFVSDFCHPGKTF